MSRDEQHPELREDATEIAAIVLRRGADGRPVYTQDEIRQFLPYALLFLCRRLTLESEILRRFLTSFLLDLGVSKEMSPEEVLAVAKRHYARCPPNARMLTEVRQLLRAQAGRRSSGPSKSAARLIGLEPRALPVPPSRAGARSEGPICPSLLAKKL